MSQSKYSLTLGGFYNGTSFSDDVNGIGLITGLQYMPGEEHFFSIELRAKYGYYSFDDGTKWTQNSNGDIKEPIRSEARLEYSLFSPQISLVPKFYLHFDEFSLFVENELVAGLMSGKFEFKNNQKTKFTEPIFCYNIGVGGEVTENKWGLVGSITFSTLNFRNKIKKHKPLGYDEWIPNQSALFMVSIIFKLSL